MTLRFTMYYRCIILKLFLLVEQNLLQDCGNSTANAVLFPIASFSAIDISLR